MFPQLQMANTMLLLGVWCESEKFLSPGSLGSETVARGSHRHCSKAPLFKHLYRHFLLFCAVPFCPTVNNIHSAKQDSAKLCEPGASGDIGRSSCTPRPRGQEAESRLLVEACVPDALHTRSCTGGAARKPLTGPSTHCTHFCGYSGNEPSH